MHRRLFLQSFGAVLGAAVVGHVVEAADAGRPAHAAPPTSALTARQRAMVRALTEHVIPRTDTPGAIDTKVPEFVDHVLSTWYTPADRTAFLVGFNALDDWCTARHGVKFLDASHEAQVAALTAQDLPSRDYRVGPLQGVTAGPDTTAPFFIQLKALTVVGYYTSEVGATQELRYNPMPGWYRGDFDFSEAGRPWST